MVISDLCLYLGSVLLVTFLREGIDFEKVVTSSGHWFIAATLVLFLYIFGSYDLTHSTSSTRLIGRTFLALFMGLVLVIFVHYLGAKDRAGIFGRGILFGSFGLFGFLALLVRWGLSSYLKQTFRKARFLLVGTVEDSQKFRQDLTKNPFRSQMFYCLDQKTNEISDSVLGTWDSLAKILSTPFQTVVVSTSQAFPEAAMSALLRSRFETNRVRDITDFYEETWKKVPLSHLNPQWFLSVDGFNLMGNPIRIRLKRLMDVIISTLMIIFTLPLMLLTAIAIYFESPGGVIYRQVRTGRGGKTFVIFKFRSMVQDAEKSGVQWAQKNDSRVTRLGAFIRKVRIDELPQLFNVLEGSMSFVGPRPERPEIIEDLKTKIEYYNFRHLVQPGLTGWAQILYPYGASIDDAKEKLQYDLFYIKNYSLWLDISIILKTITVVLLGRGR
ncbi:MAG: sugar transferase [Pseudobdellovibrionaceae bacterium]